MKTLNLSDNPAFSIEPYDTVILGASVYIEKIQKEMTEFCKVNKESLLEKKLGLYICSGNIKGTHYLKLFGKELFKHAVSKKMLGSEIYWEKMNGFDKLITRIVKRTKTSKSELNTEAIAELAEELQI